jgi:hypothetical protein
MIRALLERVMALSSGDFRSSAWLLGITAEGEVHGKDKKEEQ